MNSPDVISSDSSDGAPPSDRFNRVPWGRVGTVAVLTTMTVAGAPTARQPLPAPIKAGEKVELQFAYQAYSNGDAYNISTQPGVGGSNQTGTQSPTYVGIGVTFDQYPGERSRNKAYLVAWVEDRDSNASLVSGVATIGNEPHVMQPDREGDFERLMVKLDCEDVPRSRNLPVEVTFSRSDGSKGSASTLVDSRSIDSSRRSCVPKSEPGLLA